MKIFFLLLLSSYKFENLTFENMFNNELENVLKEKEKEFRKNENEAECNVVAFFVLDENKLANKSITEIKNDLFHKLKIEDTGKSIIAFEFKNCNFDLINWEKYYLKRFIKKIEQKLENPDIKISELSPDDLFGIITEGFIDTKDKILKETSQKDVNIKEKDPKDDDYYAKKIGNDIVFPKLISPLICLFSNFQMTKPDLEYCLKIFDAIKIKTDNFEKSFSCLALKINDKKIENFPKLLNDCCKSYSNEEKIFEFKKIVIHM